ncbi:PREDICTED: protein croquemort-like isoform X2 [Nicrophorus vespilloides]|uniref:Protein croquemort-like isoform X2 n=1 Tax=Nicrophorus vespilloides TaxID=110193 RepID=A0ABM1N1D5_NICVS|nr:PREDICTED: protein croquemort-like isoform X2 [Nicrophorus vespilloides]
MAKNNKTFFLNVSTIICNKLFLIIGIALAILGVTLYVTFPWILQSLIRIATTFKPGWKAYNEWKCNPEPYYFDIYLFNWTNTEDFYNPDVKPKFEEIGPYRFLLNIEKMNETWSEGDTFNYSIAKKFVFVKHEDSRDLTDLITSINPVPLSLAYQFRNSNYFTKLAISLTLRSTKSEMFVTKTADEFLFRGFEEPTLDAANKIPFVKIMDKFGYFYKKNYTEYMYGPVTMHKTQDENFARLSTYRNKKNPGFFDGKCGTTDGRIGEFVETNRNSSKILKVFVPEICTYTYLKYKEQRVYKGVVSDYYEAPKTLFDNGTVYPENECFCNGQCVPSGLLNVSSCNENAPIFLSLPHFFHADPSYRNAVEGMKPDPDKHNVFTAYQKDSGVVTAIGLRIQVNVLIQPISGFGMYSNVPKYFIPVLHINETVLMTDSVASQMYIIQVSPNISTLISCLLTVIGVTLFTYGFMKKKPNKNDNKLYDLYDKQEFQKYIYNDNFIKVID